MELKASFAIPVPEQEWVGGGPMATRLYDGHGMYFHA